MRWLCSERFRKPELREDRGVKLNEEDSNSRGGDESAEQKHSPKISGDLKKRKRRV